MTNTCKVCHYTFGAWRVHCPACSALTVKFFGHRWNTVKDGIIDKHMGRAHGAFDVEIVIARRGLKTGLADPDA